MAKERRQWSKDQKLRIIQEVEVNGLQPTLRKYNLSQSLFHKWKRTFNEQGAMGLEPQYSKVDPEKRKMEQEIMRFGQQPIEGTIHAFARSTPGKQLKQGAFSGRRDYDPLFSYSSSLLHYFNYFGLCGFIPITNSDKKITRYDDSIAAVIPTELGGNLGKILSGQEIVRWNIDCLKELGFFKGDVRDDPDFVPLYKMMAPVFPGGTIKNTVSAVPAIEKGCFLFKVSVSPGVWRKIQLSHLHTLLDLHEAIQDAFDFDDDHLYSFFMDAKRYSRNAYESPNSENGPYVDEVTIGKLELYEGQRILYLFNYGDSWEFNIVLEKIDSSGPLPFNPKIVEKKGKSPEQYRYF